MALEPANNAPKLANQDEQHEVGHYLLGKVRTYETVISADAYRDGGSLEACFGCGDGKFETVWLQARPDSPQMRSFVHRELLIYPDADRTGPATKIIKSSPGEAAILAALAAFLEHPKVDVPFAHRTPKEEFLRVVRSLAASTPLRVADAQPA